MAMNDDKLMHALAHMAALGDDAVNPRAEARARAAMHAAVDAGASMGAARRLAARMSDAITTRRFMTAGTLFAAGAAAVTAVGWSAPVGSPLHAIRVAREDVVLAVPGVDRVGLTLGFAEDRLRQAAGGQDPGAALAEAQHLLDDARAQLASHGSGADWSRWNNDESLLTTLSSGQPSISAPGLGGDDSGSANDPHGGGGATPGGGPGPSGTGGGGQGPSGTSGGSSSSTTTSSSTTSATTTRTTTSGGSSGSGDSGSGGSSGGSGSSTSSQTSTSSDSGGSGSRGGPGPGSGGSSSSTTSSSSTSTH